MSFNFDGQERPLRAGDAGLLTCPSFVGDESRLCRTLSSLDGRAGRHLAITFTRSPDECLARLGSVAEWDPLVSVVHVAGANDHLLRNGVSADSSDGTDPPETGSNAVHSDDGERGGDRTDGPAEAGPEASDGRHADRGRGVTEPAGSLQPGTRNGGVPDVVGVETVDAPGNPTGLGVATIDALETLSCADPQDSDGSTTACFDSITALLQYVDGETAFRFLHALGAAFDDADVAAHYHLNPGAHDEETLRTLEPLFDVVWEYEDGGDFAVRRP